MPELPEVELVASSLGVLVSGKVISAAELRRHRLAPDIAAEDFASALRGASINFIHRRGKHILFDLDNGRTLIVHLRMSGRFSLLSPETEDPKFAHAIFHITDGTRLVFDDQRHFGLMKVVLSSALEDAKELKKLAPEPFSEQFSVEYLSAALKSTTRSLKEFLLDQTKVCGLGNIYAAEAMFAAGIDPRIPANKVSAPKARRLHASIRAVLSEAIEGSRTSEIDAENIDGKYFSGRGPGWLVYDREGEPCVLCEKPIIRLKQGGRSTYYCGKCQRR